MIIFPLLAAAAQVVASSGTAEEAAKEQHASVLFSDLEGRWSCRGAFANGKVLEADLLFVRAADGRGLRFSHADKAPHDFRLESHWGLDKETGKVVSIGFSAFGADRRPTAALYVSDAWTSSSITLEQKRLFSDPFAANRFVYSIVGQKLKMVWEVNKTGEWRWGDYLYCDLVDKQH